MYPMRLITQCMVASLCAATAQAQSLVADFDNLFERCRISIESSAPFDATEMEKTKVQDRHERDWGITSEQVGWSLKPSILYVVSTSWTSRDGPTRHLCEIYLKDPERILTASEQGLLLRSFFVFQTRLIGAGNHDVDRDLSPIPPALNAAFLLSERNPRGCSVNNTIALSPDGSYFSAGSGEQAIKSCASQ